MEIKTPPKIRDYAYHICRAWYNGSKWRQKCSPLQINESLTSKIIELLTEKTWTQGCVIQQREKWPRVEFTSFERRKYFEWIIKQLLNSAFVGMKNSADLGGCYPPRPSASVDNTLLDLQNSSYPTCTQPHSIIANYTVLHPLRSSQLFCKIMATNILQTNPLLTSHLHLVAAATFCS